jgi:hypothetical protein
MASTIRPGLKFYCTPLPTTQSVLMRTPSTYGYGSSLELRPRPNVLYVICADGSVQAAHDPEIPIGWCVFENENGWFYQITQVGFEPVSCILTYHSSVAEPPLGEKQVGTSVQVCYSRDAAIFESEENGEPEVTSAPTQDS